MSEELMPGEKIVRTRTKHDCCFCDIPIEPGELAKFSSYKTPRLGDDYETQVGIEYQKFWSHFNTGCQERMTIQYRGQTVYANPFFWDSEWWGCVYLYLDDKSGCLYHGKTIQEAIENMIAGNLIDPEWEEERRDVY